MQLAMQALEARMGRRNAPGRRRATTAQEQLYPPHGLNHDTNTPKNHIKLYKIIKTNIKSYENHVKSYENHTKPDENHIKSYENQSK